MLKDNNLKGKKQYKNWLKTAKIKDFKAVELSKLFDSELVESLGRESGFVQRKSKLSASKFLNILMFAHHQGKSLSLLDLTGDLHEQFNIRLAKQSLDERFNSSSVKFMKSVLSYLLNKQLDAKKQNGQLNNFNRVRIKDSTRFALPERYASTYQGYGGGLPNSKSMISIQYEYDLITGKTMDFRLTNGLCNDQADSRDHTHEIMENDLFIRDLGYCSTGYLKQLVDHKAFFLNRLSPQTAVYQVGSPNKAIDPITCLKKIKKHNLPYLVYDVLVGSRVKLPCRMVVSAVDDSTYEKRLRKTTKMAKSKGCNVSEEYKSKARLNMFITNVPDEWIPSEKIKSIYGLRWQIELIFKVWKSQAKINSIKEMKIHRFECQLLGKIIWLLINWRIFYWLKETLNNDQADVSCSVWKFYKSAFRLSYKLRTALKCINKAKQLLDTLINMDIQLFALEKRSQKQSHFEIVKSLT